MKKTPIFPDGDSWPVKPSSKPKSKRPRLVFGRRRLIDRTGQLLDVEMRKTVVAVRPVGFPRGEKTKRLGEVAGFVMEQ